MIREAAIEAFLSAAREAFAASDLGPEAAATIEKIYGALGTVGAAGSSDKQRLPVCDDCLSPALETARKASPALARVADAFAAVEPRLSWAPRSAGGPNASANWPEGHANAMIVGPGGREKRNDVQIGVSLLAPHVQYPDHTHAPEEVYLVLSRGRFKHGASGWFEPGIGGTLYNEPNIVHAMASDDEPLLALWWLGTGKAA